jgi:hypothetical protein
MFRLVGCFAHVIDCHMRKLLSFMMIALSMKSSENRKLSKLAYYKQIPLKGRLVYHIVVTIEVQNCYCRAFHGKLDTRFPPSSSLAYGSYIVLLYDGIKNQFRPSRIGKRLSIFHLQHHGLCELHISMMIFWVIVQRKSSTRFLHVLFLSGVSLQPLRLYQVHAHFAICLKMNCTVSYCAVGWRLFGVGYPTSSLMYVRGCYTFLM